MIIHYNFLFSSLLFINLITHKNLSKKDMVQNVEIPKTHTNKFRKLFCFKKQVLMLV